MATDRKIAGGYVPELDGVRGLAILMVVVWHYFVTFENCRPAAYVHPGWLWILWQWVCRLFSMTWSGVDLFFVLSGFLLGGILLDQRQTGWNLKGFYLRRAARVLPLYFILLGVVFTVRHSALFLLPHWRFFFGGHIPLWVCAVFSQNIYWGWFNLFESGALNFTWSLAVEEQFYLFLPFLLRWLAQNWFAPVISMLILSATLFRAIALWKVNIFFTELLLPGRMDALLIGVLLAWGIRHEGFPSWKSKYQQLIGWALLALLLGYVGLSLGKVSYNSWAKSMIALPFISMLYGVLILWVVIHAGTARTRFFVWKWLMGLGSISYGLYLIHQIVSFTAHELLLKKYPGLSSWPQFGVALLALALSLLLARASWIFLEKPIIRAMRARTTNPA